MGRENNSNQDGDRMLSCMQVPFLQKQDKAYKKEQRDKVEYRKLPLISPGLIQLRKGFLVGL